MAFQIKNFTNNKYGITLNSKHDGLKLEKISSGSSAQEWSIAPGVSNDGSTSGFIIYNKATNLAIAYDSNNKPAKVEGFQIGSAPVYTVSSNMLWQLTQSSDGSFAIRWVRDVNGQILESKGDDVEGDPIIETWNYNHGDNQKWALISL